MRRTGVATAQLRPLTRRRGDREQENYDDVRLHPPAQLCPRAARSCGGRVPPARARPDALQHSCRRGRGGEVTDKPVYLSFIQETDVTSNYRTPLADPRPLPRGAYAMLESATCVVLPAITDVQREQYSVYVTQQMQELIANRLLSNPVCSAEASLLLAMPVRSYADIYALIEPIRTLCKAHKLSKEDTVSYMETVSSLDGWRERIERAAEKGWDTARVATLANLPLKAAHDAVAYQYRASQQLDQLLVLAETVDSLAVLPPGEEGVYHRCLGLWVCPVHTKTGHERGKGAEIALMKQYIW